MPKRYGTPPAVIELSHIQRTFQVGDQTVHALDDVTLEGLVCSNHDLLALLGPSSCTVSPRAAAH